MKIVTARFCHQRDLRSGGTPLVGIRVRGRYAEFLQRVRGRAQHTGKGFLSHDVQSALAFIYVGSVESDVRLIGPSSIYIARARDPRLKRKKPDYVAGV